MGFAISAEGDKIRGRGEDVEIKNKTLIRHRWDCDGWLNDTTQPRPLSALIVAHRAPLKQFNKKARTKG